MSSDTCRSGTAKYLVVGAIDFGTSYSGYAYSFTPTPTDIVRKRWNAGSRGLVSEKAPTCILLTNNEEFESFGFDAEDEFAEICYEKKQDEFYFCKGYKMALYNHMVVRKDKTVKDIRGREMSLMKVVTETIKFLKQEMFNDIETRVDKLEPTDVLYVLTVPAIWTDSAKGFMRDAAEAAGIAGEQLLICLEPEAAARFCQTVLWQSQSPLSPSQLNCFHPGNKYIVIDAGGGTADIVVQEVEANGGLKEILPASGADWGGTTVDREFLAYMRNVHGQEAFDEFTKKEVLDYCDLMREFEVKKRSQTVQGQTKPVRLRIPTSLRNLSQANQDKARSVREEEDFNSMTLGHYTIRLNHERFRQFFQTSTENIISHVQQLIDNDEFKDVSTIVLVGGYAESKFLQDFIKSKFSSKTVIIPNQPGLAVLKGAVLFGHYPPIIAERICKYTYGIGCNLPFDDKFHEESTKFTSDFGSILAQNCFDIHCKVGQNVKTDVFQNGKNYVPTTTNQRTAVFPIYASRRSNPVYVTESDCFKIGKLTVDISDLTGSKSDRGVLVALCFGGTEITIKATKKQTGEVLSSSFKYDW